MQQETIPKPKLPTSDAICGICGLVVMSHENYIKIMNFRNEVLVGESIHHEKCYVDKMQNKGVMAEMINRTFGLLNKAEKQLE